MNVFFSKNTDRLIDTLNHPSMISMFDDSGCDIKNIELDDDLFIIECHNNNKYIGCFLLEKKSDLGLNVHSCILPAGRGMARKFAKKAINLIFSSTKFIVLSAIIPSYNKLSENLIKRLGFLFIGRGKKYIVNGNSINTSMYIFHRGMLWA